ncbi:alpha/beta fold hydrolase [Geminocystis herdmanii]|uniref:alpha/beta fold hydrolase n=1 Tax=Geminocystis herdmanii TaxID=669359 RepID=UPI00034C8E1A|nr:alpha/beta hydrolase [Geminocystis herdmanii]
MLSQIILDRSQKLTESTSINLFQQIQFTPVEVAFSPLPINTSYAVTGKEKPPILLLHGFDSSLLEFRRLMPFLSHNHQVWALDLLGFGFTNRQSSIDYSPDTIKQHLYQFWLKMIQKPVILIGASMGGASAIDFCLSYPQAVEKLVLLDSGGLLKQPIIGKFLFPPLGFLATEFLRNLKVRQSISETAYFDRTFAHEDALTCAGLHLECQYWNQALISFTKSGGYGSFASELPKIPQPCLTIWGENDKILGTKSATEFQELIPENKLIWIKNCGHVPHLEQAEITANHILNFT